MTFETLDYIIFGGSLAISAAIGLYCRFSGGKQKTNEEYLVGDRKQNPIIIAVSLMTSFMSAVSMLGGSAEAYAYGTQFFTMNIGYLIGIILALILYIPVFYELKHVSVYMYLNLRFGRTMCVCASLAFVVQMLLYSCIALVAPAIALQTVTNISQEWSIIVVGLVVTFYATLGGMKAIIFTDFFQAILMFGALFSIIYSGYSKYGGFWGVLNIAHDHGRIIFDEFRVDPTIRHSWLSTVMGGIFNSLFLKGINQAQVQRYMTMKDYKTVTISALLSWPLITALSMTICFTGLIVFAKYHDCDPIRTGRIPKPDHLLALFVIDSFNGSGLAGVFVAGIFSASLSTVSPLFNSLAAVTFEDYAKPLMKKCRGIEIDSRSSSITQILAFTYGLICILLALMALSAASIIQASLIVFSVVGGPMLGVFTLGMFTLSANQKGALIGFAAGLVSGSFLSLGQPRPKLIPLPSRIDGCSPSSHFLNVTMASSVPSNDAYPYLFRISYMYYGVIGFAITFTVGYLCSLLMADDRKNKNLDPKLFIKPVAAKLKTHHILLTDLDTSKDNAEK